MSGQKNRPAEAGGGSYCSVHQPGRELELMLKLAEKQLLNFDEYGKRIPCSANEQQRQARREAQRESLAEAAQTLGVYEEAKREVVALLAELDQEAARLRGEITRRHYGGRGTSTYGVEKWDGAKRLRRDDMEVKMP